MTEPLPWQIACDLRGCDVLYQFNIDKLEHNLIHNGWHFIIRMEDWDQFWPTIHVTIPNRPPEPSPTTTIVQPPQIVPRCCLSCNLAVTFDFGSRTWRLLHNNPNGTASERTFADEKIQEALPWLETLHAAT